ncbi:MAG: hypothetical protein ACRBHB_22835 [Arenicella sp.]
MIDLMVSRASFLHLVLPLSIVLMPSAALARQADVTVMAEYKVSKKIAQEELDKIFDPLTKVEITEAAETIKFDIYNEKFRSYRKRRGQSNVTATAAMYEAMAATPEMKKLVDDFNGTKLGKSVINVEVQDAHEKRALKTEEKTSYNSKRGESIVKRQSYYKLRPAPKECKPNYFGFRQNQFKTLLGCGLQERIDKKRIVKTGESEKIEIQLRQHDKELFQTSVVKCDYYKPKPKGVKQADESGRKWCIAYLADMPVAVRFVSYQSLAEQHETSFKSYDLMNLDLSPGFKKTYFNFKSAEVCTDGKTKGTGAGAWTVCKYRSTS